MHLCVLYSIIALSLLCVQSQNLSDTKPENWCGTEHEYLPGRSLQKGPLDQDCPAQTQCDEPDFRARYLVAGLPLLVLRTYWIIFAPTSADLDDVRWKERMTKGVFQQMLLLNSSYKPAEIAFAHEIQFVYDAKYTTVTSSTSVDSEASAMKLAYAVDFDTKINIFQTSIRGGVLGLATFPWATASGTKLGGIVLGPNFGEIFPPYRGYTLVHEMGHQLGLYHTHQDVAMGGCGLCQDQAGSHSDVLGDRIADTPPTPTNYHCNEPQDTDCNGLSFAPTDYMNWMGYSNDECMARGHFTRLQYARVRCVVDSILRNFSYEVSSITCNTIADCERQANKCFESRCVSGYCFYTPRNYSYCPSKPCQIVNCDTTSGECVYTPRVCLPAKGLENCATAYCNLATSKCVQNISKCAGVQVATNSCCEKSEKPFCVNTTRAGCVCNTFSHCCFSEWDDSCVHQVAHCDRVCTPPPPVFPNVNIYNYHKLNKWDLDDRRVFRGTASEASSITCEGLGLTITGYGAWWNVKEPYNITTCRGLAGGEIDNEVPTGILVVDRNTFKCYEWQEFPDVCNGFSSVSIPASVKIMDQLVFVYSKFPLSLEVSFSRNN